MATSADEKKPVGHRNSTRMASGRPNLRRTFRAELLARVS